MAPVEEAALLCCLDSSSGLGYSFPTFMNENKLPHSYPWRWLIKAMVIPVTIALVTALQVSPVVAPLFVSGMATPLVSFSVIDFPTRSPSPTATDVTPPLLPTQMPLPTATETLVPPTPTFTSTPMPSPTPTVRPTPTLAFARPISVPLSAPTPNDARRVASVPILMYHYISDPPPGSDRYRLALSVTPANFDAQMAFLKQAGYHAITLYDLHAYLVQGTALPDKPIVLTFDDGYADAFTQAINWFNNRVSTTGFLDYLRNMAETAQGKQLT